MNELDAPPVNGPVAAKPKLALHVLRVVGAVLLFSYLPPVMGLIAFRWKKPSARLRWSALIASCLTMSCMIGAFAALFMTGDIFLHLMGVAYGWTMFATGVFLSLCYMNEKKIRPSLFLKITTAVIAAVMVCFTFVVIWQLSPQL